MVPEQPPNLIRRLKYLYCGRAAQGSTPPGPVSLITTGEELGVPVRRPAREAVILVAGDIGSGKSAFVNALVEEIVLPVGKPHPAVQWVCSEDLPSGASPCLFAEARREFSGWPVSSQGALASCIVRCSSPRLSNTEVVEVKTDTDTNALEWVGARADIVVCLLDSQKQPPASEKLLQWIGKIQHTAGEPPLDGQARPNIQFVLSKMDLVQRESDRIRLVAKASKLLTERLGRGFEILPVATGDLDALLDGLSEGTSLDCFTLGDHKFEMPRSFVKSGEFQGGASARKRMDEGPKRAILAAQQVVEQRTTEGLAQLRTDCEALASALGTQLAEAKTRAQAESGSTDLRPKLFQLGGAMLIVGLVVPFFLDSDLDPWIAQICRGVALAVGAVLLVLAALVPPSVDGGKSSSHTGPASKCVTVLEERGRFLRLARRQHARWVGEEDPTKADVSTMVAEDATPATGLVLTCRTGASKVGVADEGGKVFM